MVQYGGHLYHAAPTTSGLAVASFVVSLVGIAGCLAFAPLVLITAVPAIAMGHVARTQIKRSNGALGGDGLAIAGLVIGYVQIALMCAGFILGASLLVFAKDLFR